jgi:hypothetical protein
MEAGASAQAEERQDCHDHDDQADKIDQLMHGRLHLDARKPAVETNAPCRGKFLIALHQCVHDPLTAEQICYLLSSQRQRVGSAVRSAASPARRSERRPLNAERGNIRNNLEAPAAW